MAEGVPAQRGEADFVLDASAVAKLFLEEPESPAFRTWYRAQVRRGARFAAPGLLGYEVAQLVAKNVKVSAGGFAARVRQPLEGIHLHPAFDTVGPFVGPLTAYDASYLATAATFGAILVSYDRALLRAAQAHAVPAEAP
jgi:predicted nucleic acid-binding protein